MADFLDTAGFCLLLATGFGCWALYKWVRGQPWGRPEEEEEEEEEEAGPHG